MAKKKMNKENGDEYEHLKEKKTISYNQKRI